MREPTYVDTPRGIFTSGSTWFHTRENTLREYAGGVLEHVPLTRLLLLAEVWLRSAGVVAIWMMPVLLLTLPPVAAVIVGLVVYLLWQAFSPAFVSIVAARIFILLDNVFLTGLYYIVAISYLAAIDQFTAVWVGLAWFILVRWQIITRVTRPILEPLWRSLYPLPVNDQVLRALIIRAALKHHVSIPELDAIESQIRSTLNRQK